MAGYRRVQLTWDVLPDVAFNREVTFTSSDESIATVDENGVVTGVTQGEAVITATTKDGGFTDTCQVSVTGDACTDLRICGHSVCRHNQWPPGLSVYGALVHLFRCVPGAATATWHDAGFYRRCTGEYPVRRAG